MVTYIGMLNFTDKGIQSVKETNEQALAAFSLAVAMQGNVRTRSLRAYTAGEMDEILAKLP